MNKKDVYKKEAPFIAASGLFHYRLFTKYGQWKR